MINKITFHFAKIKPYLPKVILMFIRKTFLLFYLLIIINPFLFSQRKIILNYENIPYTDTCLIFTPSKIEKAKMYPLVILLHGYSGNYKQWNDIIDLQVLADKYNFILVCPDGFYSCWYVNSPINKKSQFESFLFKIFIPEIYNSYKIDKENIFISGLSMGGFGAISLFINNPNFFKAAGSTSGILDIIPFKNRWNMNNIFGNFDENKKYYIDFSPINNLEKISTHQKKIIIDCGADDFGFDVNKNFYERCKSLKILATFISQPGDHNYKYWKNSIKQHLNFFSELVKEN